RHLDFVFKFLETGYAAQLHRLRERSVRPERAIGNPEIEMVTHRADTTNFLRHHIAKRTIFLALEMETSRRDLVQMDLHCVMRATARGEKMMKHEGRRKSECSNDQKEGALRFSSFGFRHSFVLRHSSFVIRLLRGNFFASASPTTAGTNAETSPPSRAISFTMRELR